MNSFRSVDENGIIHYKNEKGDLHRTDGPAVEWLRGYKAWLINGKYHREDGPAVINSDGEEIYCLYGNRYSKEEWEREVAKLKLKRIKDL